MYVCCMYVCMYVCVCMCVHMYVCMDACMYVCAYILSTSVLHSVDTPCPQRPIFEEAKEIISSPKGSKYHYSRYLGPKRFRV